MGQAAATVEQMQSYIKMVNPKVVTLRFSEAQLPWIRITSVVWE